jgi:hypothetical protein
MTSISLSDLFTIIFVLVDDWYQAHGIKMLKIQVRANFWGSSERITRIYSKSWWAKANSTAEPDPCACWFKNCIAIG